jgi:hypothetical protein
MVVNSSAAATSGGRFPRRRRHTIVQAAHRLRPDPAEELMQSDRAEQPIPPTSQSPDPMPDAVA